MGKRELKIMIIILLSGILINQNATAKSSRKYPKGLLDCVCKVEGVDCGCDNPLIGRPLRIIYANCQTLLHKPKIFADSIEQALKKGQYFWIFPVLCVEYSRGAEIQLKYNEKQKAFEEAWCDPYGVNAFDIFEIASVWRIEKGYNPVLVQCHYNTFFHIPELGTDNLTYISPTYRPIDKEHPTLRKSQYLIRYIEANENEAIVFKEMMKMKPLAKIKSFSKNIDFGFDYKKSEFRNISKTEETLSNFYCGGEGGTLLKKLNKHYSKPYTEYCPEIQDGYGFVSDKHLK